MNTVLKIGLISIGAFVLFSYKKITDIKSITEGLEFSVTRLSNIKLSFTNFKATLTLQIKNNSNISFNTNFGQILTIKKINVYNTTGVFLGHANVNVFGIDLPANDYTQIDNIEAVLDFKAITDEFFDNINYYLQNDFSQLVYEVEIEVLGKIFKFNA